MDDTQEIPVTAAPLPVDFAVEPDDIDDDFLPKPKQRIGKLTVALVALVLLGGGFLIGVDVQKGRPTSASDRGGALRSAFAGRGGTGGTGGTGTGGFGGFGGFGGTATGGTGAGGTGAGGTGTGSAGSGGAGTGGATTPAVIGTIASVSGSTIVVKNFGGQSVTVKLSSSTAVTKTVPTSALTKGETVTVVGTKGSDGSVAATSVSAR